MSKATQKTGSKKSATKKTPAKKSGTANRKKKVLVTEEPLTEPEAIAAPGSPIEQVRQPEAVTAGSQETTQTPQAVVADTPLQEPAQTTVTTGTNLPATAKPTILQRLQSLFHPVSVYVIIAGGVLVFVTIGSIKTCVEGQKLATNNKKVSASMDSTAYYLRQIAARDTVLAAFGGRYDSLRKEVSNAAAQRQNATADRVETDKQIIQKIKADEQSLNDFRERVRTGNAVDVFNEALRTRDRVSDSLARLNQVPAGNNN